MSVPKVWPVMDQGDAADGLQAFGAKGADNFRVVSGLVRSPAPIKGWLVAMARPAGEVSRGTSVSGP